jgi:hypothetical protein
MFRKRNVAATIKEEEIDKIAMFRKIQLLKINK